MQIVVMGLGNTLQQDDGVGVAAVQALLTRSEHWPHAELVDGGTLGLALLGYVEDATHLLLLDSVRTGAAPGTPVRLEGEDIPVRLSTKLSPHQAGVVDLLAAAQLRGRLPGEIVVLGIEPGKIDWGTDLTPAVARQLNTLVTAARRQLDIWEAKAATKACASSS